MSETTEAALAAALRVTMYWWADERDAAAVLAALPPGWCRHDEIIETLRGQGDGLRAEIVGMGDAIASLQDALNDRIREHGRTEAEIERLRAALRTIADEEVSETLGWGDYDYRIRDRRVARATLTPAPSKP
jgi:hypothetical protein